MSQTAKKSFIAVGIIVLVLLADQILKIWVRTSFFLGEELYITDWFRLHFIENNGMAFGMEVSDKIYLTVFRIIASLLILAYLIWCIRKQQHTLLVSCVALIFAGAVGNIIDCVFYGQIFGYAPWFEGRVVDMLYFPLIESTFPDWMPAVGGDDFVFFSPIFNIADSAIVIGVALILIFERKLFK